MNRILFPFVLIFLIVLASCGGEDSSTVCEERAKRVVPCAKDSGKEQIQYCSSGEWVDLGSCTCPASNKFCHSYSDLFWTDVSKDPLNWENSVKYCSELGGRLPTVSEIRSVIINCPEMETGGECGVTDSCLSIDCWSDSCDSYEPVSLETDQLFAFEYFNGPKEHIRSSSIVEEDQDFSWFVSRGDGINARRKSISFYFRCVRKENEDSNTGNLEDSDDSGDTGDNGNTGNTGNTTDDTGDSGDTGSSGDSGNSSDTGDTGNSGDTGCAGHFPNYYNGFLWSDISSKSMNRQDAVDYCENMCGRLPKIQELRMLIRNCPQTEYPQPDGQSPWCTKEDPEDLSGSNCWGCSTGSHYPGKHSILGDDFSLWSSSDYGTKGVNAWYVNFYNGGVTYTGKTNDNHVRCIKDADKFCGDGILDAWEECDNKIDYDGNELCEKIHGPKTFYDASVASCTESCEIISECRFCGDETLQPDSGEICDGEEKFCPEISSKYVGGLATCKKDCSGWETEDCVETFFPHSNAGLEWSDIFPEGAMIYDKAAKYCDMMGGRLPSISELRTLIRNNPKTETGGECRVTDDCLFWDDCWDSNCLGGSWDYDDPGKYSVFNDRTKLMSSSTPTGIANCLLLVVNFGRGQVYCDFDNYTALFRCVR